MACLVRFPLAHGKDLSGGIVLASFLTVHSSTDIREDQLSGTEGALQQVEHHSISADCVGFGGLAVST